MKKEKFIFNDFLDIINQILITQNHMEIRGFYHRDMKTENILYKRNKETKRVISKFGDFSEAKKFIGEKVDQRSTIV